MTSNHSKPVRIIIASELLAAKLHALVKSFPDMQLLDSATDGESVVKMCRRHMPHLVLLDIRMNTLRLAHIKEIKQLDNEIKILIVTDSRSDFEIFSAMGAGADGCLLVDNSLPLLQKAIESTLTGAIWLDGMLAPKIKSTLSYLVNISQTSKDTARALSVRELEVLELLSQGLSNREIAERLTLSSDTIKTHMRHILKKLSVSDRTKAAIIAVNRNLMP
jgi:DNA-binding NarL/FixJ family response regulator